MALLQNEEYVSVAGIFGIQLVVPSQEAFS